MSMGSGKSTGTPNPSTAFGNQPGATTFGSYPTQQQTNQFSQGVTPASTAGGQPNTLAQFAPGAGASATNLMGQNFNQGGSLTTNAPPQGFAPEIHDNMYRPERNPYLPGPGQPPGGPPIDYSAALKAPGMIGISNGQPGSFTPLSRSEDARNNYFNSITGYKRNPDGSDRNADGTSYYDSWKAANPGKDVFSINRDFQALTPEQQYGYLTPGGNMGFQQPTSQPAPPSMDAAGPQGPSMDPTALMNKYSQAVFGTPQASYALGGPNQPPIAPYRNPGLGRVMPTPASDAQLTDEFGQAIYASSNPVLRSGVQGAKDMYNTVAQPAPPSTYETLQRNLGLTRGGGTSYTAPKPTPPQIVNRNNNTIFGTNRPQQKPVAGPIAPPKQNFGRQTPTYRISAGKISK